MGGANGASWETSDLGTAAFVHMKGLAIRGARRAHDHSRRFIFVFGDPDSRGEELQIEYMNSECRAYDAAVRSLKKLCYDNPKPATARGGQGGVRQRA